MPNWMSNTMTVTGDAEELARFIVAAEGKDSLLSFQKLYPCPEELLNQSADSIHDIGYEVFFDHGDAWIRIAKYPWVIEKGILIEELDREGFRKKFKAKFKSSGYYEAGAETNKMIKKYGYKNWYDWKNAKWGVKWDTWDAKRHIFSTECVRYDYETPWSPPSTLFETVSKEYPELTFHFECNDEGYDGNEPEFIFDIQNGMMT